MWFAGNTCRIEVWNQTWQRRKADSRRLTADGVKGAEKMTRAAVSGGRTEVLRAQES